MILAHDTVTLTHTGTYPTPVYLSAYLERHNINLVILWKHKSSSKVSLR